jgi:CDP-diacylglycerol---glycerol-3-phosphate 3-phosphatidyltransferase
MNDKATVSIWNIANALTLLRLALVPVFLFALFHGDGDDALWRVLAWVAFAVASVTDRVDGEIARRRGIVTDFGKIADPIADKALIGAALVGLSLLDELAWWVTVVVIVREVGITLLRFFVIRHGVMPASRGGKVKTVLQAVALTALSLPLLLLSPPLHDLGVLLFYVFQAVLAVAVAMTMWSGYEFFRDVWRQRQVLRTG